MAIHHYLCCMHKFEDNKLDGEWMVRHFSPSICVCCSHFHGKEKGTCSAYPNGIPSRFADMIIGDGAPVQHKHDTVESDQVGSDVFNWIKHIDNI